ncbi:MAG: peptide chain release factor N(5)-glutamine methyltransferase [Eubacteriales bacterium]|nr:peptide chain release factor N(5)-glutamine methyltransferase [Eubacteriales bacterium]
MKLRDMLNEGIERLEAAGVENAAFDARQLLMRSYGKTSAELLMELDRPLCPGATGGREPAEITECPGDCGGRITFDSLIARRAKREPLQHILGSAWFMGMEFRVGPKVLIPRQDTEVLVETVLEREKDKDISVLDMCTGSGCIAAALKKLGGYSEVCASDIDEDALSIARDNAAENGVKISFILSDIFEGAGSLKFDVIVSNPPYIRSDVIATLEPEVREHDPKKALDGGPDGLKFYREIIENAGAHLKEGGRVYFEIGFDQAEAVSALLLDNGFTGIEVIKDLAGLDRVVLGRRRLCAELTK